MNPHTLTQLAQWADADLLLPSGQDGDQLLASGVSIDTRTMVSGEVFVPIIGEKMDGHRFLETAFEKSAVAAFIDRDHPEELARFRDRPLLLVEDCKVAFQTLAQNYRKSLSCTVIGVTGSNGKTTTKDILYSVFRSHYETIKTTGNLNNEIGVPRTLLDLKEETEVAIVEMGMSQRGEIEALTQMARPHIAVITNVGLSHLDSLGSREAIAQAKMEIIDRMGPNDYLLYNRDSDYLANEIDRRQQAGDLNVQVISFGQKEEADIHLHLLRSHAGGSLFTLDGQEFKINLLGSYQMYNAAPAIIAARLMGLDDSEIRAGLQVSDQTKMRSELVHATGFDILVDCYNSSPQSLGEALQTTALLAGYRKKIAILGDMLELGPNEKKLHYEMGRRINPAVFQDVIFYGPLSKYMMEGAASLFPPGHLFWFDQKNDLVDRAKYLIEPATLVLVKASRSMRLEEIVESIQVRNAR